MCFFSPGGEVWKPTWRRLVEAVEDHRGGNDYAAAQAIAREHPGVLP